MRILLLCQYYAPESVGPGVFWEHLAQDLKARGHEVTVLTSFPNYPEGRVHEGYGRKLAAWDEVRGIRVLRTWIYATNSKRTLAKAANFASFCTSSLLGGLLKLPKFDAVYAYMPPLPLGMTAIRLARAKGAKAVVNIQDIYPRAAVELGILTNPRMIRHFERMERRIYAGASRVAVISPSFKEDLEAKGVPTEKIDLTPNWADVEAMQPGPRENAYRRELGLGDRFTVLYAGSLSHNSDVEPLVRAANLLRGEQVAIVIAGEGVKKEALQELACELDLPNVKFIPFAPLERYGELLRASDLTVVTLNERATFVSVPSKVYKQMAVGRPVLAISGEGNELDRMIQDARCGLRVPPGDPGAVAEAIRRAMAMPEELRAMGERAREHAVRFHSRERCVGLIEASLRRAVEGA